MKKNLLSLLFALLIPLLVCAQNRPRVSVLGDSYSTFQGYIPEGNEAWYYTPVDTSRTDVDNVTQTWWWQVINQAGCLIEKNDSYSGATVSYHGYDNQDYSARSFITRLPRLGSPDVIFIFGGTNDDWAGAELGEYQYDHFTQADFYTYRPALAYLLQQAKERYPNVKILFIINSELRQEIVESTKVICSHYSIPYIELKNIDKKLNHPTVKGMKAIAQQVLEFINK
ncbi:MAG: hypothetical protein IJJ83_10440 [Muribaculaceae bacterium]|nr:hypothetical protein [Muribaculaceae bacterium]